MKNFPMALFLLTTILISIWNPIRIAAQSSNNISQIVTFSVEAVNQIVIAGDLKINNEKILTMNSQPVKIIHATSTYLITTNEEQKKITGVLNTVLPKDASLIVSLEAPAGARSAGLVTLKNVPLDLVTGVSKIAEPNRVITYTYTTPVSSGLTTPLSQMITLTITN